ncbi:MAG: oligosaccharyl transferase, archaeosortase A system-associated [Candidatus Nealsonbacteria bacterium]|nr:oligosaccharyl transferase, archaeosortase A system-associated [Candidatus Nealsonbacteria bacterium]
MKQKIIVIVILFLIFFLALFLRIYFSYDKVFSEPIRYASDDGVYHMRLLENELLGNHFPRRIYFDPYTYFPYGTYIHFAPLYTQLLAVFIWLVGFGRPTLELINKIAPFYPAVLGSLVVFLVYFIAKAVWDRKVAIFSAFLISFSPPLLFRSLLGANDHHVAEVLFSTLAMMFLIFALTSRKTDGKQSLDDKDVKALSFFDKLKLDFKENKKSWLFVFLTGISLGLYFLTWNGALLFLFIIFVFIISYYLIEYFLKRTQNWILFAGVIIFLITLIMITPFFNHPDVFRSAMYNIQHLGALILGLIGFIFIGVSANLFKQRRMSLKFFLYFLIITLILCLLIFKLFLPSLIEWIIKIIKSVNIGMVPHELAREIIGEMRPLGLEGAFYYFSSLFYLALMGFVIIFHQFVKKRKPEHLLIIIWTAVIMLMSSVISFFGQNRFVYYLAVNIALLSGFLIIKGFQFGWQGLRICQRIPLPASVKPYFLTGVILIIFNVLFFLIFPFPFNIGSSYPRTLPDIFQRVLEIAKAGPPTADEDWYESLKWIRENTPAPGIDYYDLYLEPGVNKEKGEINPYPYPESAYGILARWDVGHTITYYAHRIPNANPFQQGVGRKEIGVAKEPGETVFFLETDEEKATDYLDILKTKYIITDYESAHIAGSYLSKIKWAQGNFEGYHLKGEESEDSFNKYDNSMLARLHILDGREETTETEVGDRKIEFYIKPLDHFRLVYESKTKFIYSVESYRDDIKKVKIFEYVKGARIIGRTSPGEEISISAEITTNQGRKFIYQKSVETKDGSFEFIVPYSTFGENGRLSGQTQFSVFAQPYKLKFGNKEIEINISEKDVLDGKIIEI